ncbi:hypothetical protein O9X99_01860 [Agrobacterium salinitolerans]|uniref:Uncharacterized protein n=1 Tax=Agrobacterium salinitolerans TaxID=1183413 RepID=A0ABY3BUY0_9HYPH|nr:MULTISPECIES: hypothetical protein [Agrobacterium]MCZ7890412.1 hypothetical protein [Agrobacterium salinitolerans]TRA96865.1 hypothetical protein EXN23_01090 [Agrobacterium salinitolerans]
MRFLQALLMAMANLAKGAWNALDWSWRTAWSLWPFGSSGGSATPQPLDLPSKEVFEIDRSIEESHQRAADGLSNSGPAMQVKLFAGAKADDRFMTDLSLLEPAHQEWLSALSTNEKAMRVLSEATESKILMLLSGHDGAVEGLVAPKNEKTRETIPGLVTRMDEFRNRLSRESDHVLAA